MARLPALVDVIANVDDRPRGAIDFVARAVREAGFIQTTKRGRGAAEMTAADAAALLLGCYGSREPTQAVDTLQGFAGLRRARDLKTTAGAPDWLAGLLKARTAFEAVSAAIEIAPVLDSQPGQFSIRVSLRRPRLGVTVAVQMTAADHSGGRVFEVAFVGRTGPREPPPYDVTTEIRLPVLLSLHRCLHPPEERAAPPWGARPGRSGARPRR